ncbi:MAG: DNA polymerase [Fimbriiglobus sp.]
MTPPTGIISLDTETTGSDFRHGATPYFVSSCDEAGNLVCWEWDVDPLTRAVTVPPADSAALVEFLSPRGTPAGFVLQNAKFDVSALTTLRPEFGTGWRWDATHDTLLMAHLLASNRPKDLTSLAVMYLGIDVQPYEDRVKAATDAARRRCRQKDFRAEYGEWAIAKAGRPDMPSAGEKCWKLDMWLPRAMALRCPDVAADHPDWLTVLAEYAGNDAEVTVAVYKALRAEVERRGLWPIYEQRRKAMRVGYEMETSGVTLSGTRLSELRAKYRAESAAAGDRCVKIARSYGYALEMPKGAAVNGSLRSFCLGTMGLAPRRGKKAKTDAPTLDKDAMEYYRLTLPTGGKPAHFLRALQGKRSRDTAAGYMDAYAKFWTRVGTPGAGRWFRLHPSYNQVGTDTLRWSSANPNAQNISKKEDFNVRYCFGPAPGREWWSMDAKNIELRIPFYESGERELIDLFERADDPPYYGSNHLLNFHTVYPDLWEAELKQVGPEKVGTWCKKKYAATWYQYCKNGGFAVQYGGGVKTADAAFHRPGCHALLKQRFKNLEAHNRRCIDFANKHGYVETMPDRTVDPARGYPLLCARTENGRVLETVPLNYRTQGTAMQWTEKAMVRTADRLDEWWRSDGFDGFITIQVHDEIVFDFPKRGDPAGDMKYSNLGRALVLQGLMARGGEDIGVPTPVGIEYHADNWATGVTF